MRASYRVSLNYYNRINFRRSSLNIKRQIYTKHQRCLPNSICDQKNDALQQSSSNRYFSSSKAEALNQLKEAVKELSQGAAKPMTQPSAESLVEWNKQPLDSLTIDQLEDLGRALFEGNEGLEQDLTRAVEVWTEGAKQGSVESMYSRAVCIREGKGVPADPTAAFMELIKIADEHNYALAHYAAAIMLSSGEGVEQDHKRAYRHFRYAGRGGIAPAFYNIGNAYAEGLGVDKDDKKAYMAYTAAVELGDPAAMFTLGTWLYKGRGDAVPADKKRSFDIHLKGANAGHPLCMFNIGCAYLEGAAVAADEVKAAEWFEKAAEMKVFHAAVNASNLYRDGKGVKQDLLRARSILEPFLASPNKEHSNIANELIIEIIKRINN